MQQVDHEFSCRTLIKAFITTKMGPKKKKVKEELLVNISMNENNEIELLEVEEENSQDSQLAMEEEIDDAEQEDSEEGEEVETKFIGSYDDGHMLITIGDLSKTVCVRCKRAFSNKETYKKHVKNCDMKNEKKVDTLQLEKAAANVAEPGEEFEKYYKKNPENPCYCCGEDLEMAHVGVIKCKFCPKSFKTFASMERHIKTIHDENSKFPCPQCNAKCVSKAILDEHLQTHQEGKPFSCIQCGKDFTRKYHLERHFNHAKCAGNAKPKNQFPCEVCQKAFSRIDNLREHLRGHMGEAIRKRDYQCPHCPKSFYGSSLLNIHIRTHTGEKPFPCDLCPKSFPSNGALRKHRRMHTGERPYECSECASTFAAKETLNRHKKTHTNDKPHKCHECGKRFIQATQLRSHMFHHTGESEYVCTVCNRAFNRKIRLTEHMKYTHEGHKPLECSHCPKTFVRKEDLHRHEEVHLSTKNYSCDVCMKAFTTKPALKLHLRTHIKEDPVKCNECHKTFIRMDCLMRHVRSKHRNCLEEIIQVAEEKKLEEEKANKTEDPAETTVITIDGEVYQIDNIGEIGDGTIVVEKITEDPIETEGTMILPFYDGDEEEEMEEHATEEFEEEPVVVTKTEIESEIEIEEQETIKIEKMESPKTSKKMDDSVPIFLSDKALKESVAELLEFLIDEETLKEFGWPKASVEKVLPLVIERCGLKPSTDTNDGMDVGSRIRENTKILFALTMEGDNIKSLLNNHTIDEVIVNVLKTKHE